MRTAQRLLFDLALFATVSIASILWSATPSRATLWGLYYFSNDAFGECADLRLTPDTRIGKCVSALRLADLNQRGADFLFEMLAEAYLDEYDFQSAVAIYERAMKTTRDNDQALFHYLRGLAFVRWGKTDLATAEFVEAARGGYEDYADVGLAEIAADKDQLDKAIDLYKKALALGDQDYTLMSHLAFGYARSGDYENAMKMDNELVADLHVDPFPFAERCWQRAVLNRDVNLALDDCNEALGLLPDEPNILDSRGLVHFRQGRWDDAIADYKAAISHNPRFASSLFMLGVTEIRKGDTKDGNDHIAAALAIYPHISAEYASYGVTP